MHRNIKILLLTVLSVFAGNSNLADEPSEERVVLRVRATIDAPDIRFTVSSTVIAEIGEGFETKIKLRDYRLRLIVEDERDKEFSIRLDLFDPQGAVIDSVTVLASQIEPGNFELSSDQVASSGNVRVMDVIAQSIDE